MRKELGRSQAQYASAVNAILLAHAKHRSIPSLGSRGTACMVQREADAGGLGWRYGGPLAPARLVLPKITLK